MSVPLIRAFRHPLIWLSIVLLLVNDHLLKTYSPSWVTGKISDFAGLFFFPFLIGVLFQASKIKPIPSRQALMAGFFLTASIFIGIKTMPMANAWASGFLSIIYEQAIHIALDPTDCVALVVFIPAWIMWLHIEGQIENTAPEKITYLALVLGSLASLATSPCAPVEKITRLAFDGGTLFGGIDFTNRFETGGTVLAGSNGWEDWHLALYNQYNGTTWLAAPNYEALINKNPFREPRKLPATVCDPIKPITCYRIDGTAKVEESQDNGESWTVAWMPPPNREDFRNRMAGGAVLDCGKIPDLKTFDLVLYPDSKGATLLVAMGNEGLLVHPADGGWQAVGVNSAPGDAIGIRINPTPYGASSLGQAIYSTCIEFLLSVTAGLLVWSILSIWLREKIIRHIETPKKIKRIFLPAIIIFILTLLIPAGILYLTPRNSILILSANPFWIVLLALALWHITTLPRNIPGSLRKLDWSVFLWGILVFIAGWLPMGLWAYGIIELYQPALVLSIGSGIAVLALGIFWLHKRLNAK